MESMKLSDKLMILFTAVIAITGIIGAVIFYYQLDAMKGQLAEMKSGSGDTHELAVAAGKQADAAKTQSENTIKLAVAAKKQADAAADQVKKLQAGVQETSRLASAAQDANGISKQAMENQTRPWIGIEGDPQLTSFRITPAGILRMTFDFVVRNYGQSPAILAGTPHFILSDLVKPEPRMWVVNGKQDVCDYGEPLPGGPRGAPRFPQPVFQGSASIHHIFVDQTLTAQDPPFSDLQLYTFLSGCIVYSGTIGGPYKTRVIYRVLYSSSEEKTAENGAKYHPIASIERNYFDAF
ncbi:MAG TPA: hypothetical protein VJN89_23115 [Candidatus Acidoferrum sp.]|nr:hypothetical protein [Candidatus Acidoferrum sp.]